MVNPDHITKDVEEEIDVDPETMKNPAQFAMVKQAKKLVKEVTDTEEMMVSVAQETTMEVLIMKEEMTDPEDIIMMEEEEKIINLEEITKVKEDKKEEKKDTTVKEETIIMEVKEETIITEVKEETITEVKEDNKQEELQEPTTPPID
jgi:hypothetical protein